jgi:uncharacterized protein YeaO (DUF488 family)
MIGLKRVDDDPDGDDGVRVLVDRVWPRGLSKKAAKVDEWAKEAAPSHDLRRWFGHDPDRWDEFRRRYCDELDDRPACWQPILEAARGGAVTLVYAARDRERNNAVVLKSYLEQKL